MVTALHHRPLSASGAARDATAQQATPPALEAFPMKLRGGDIVSDEGDRMGARRRWRRYGSGRSKGDADDSVTAVAWKVLTA